MIGENAPLPSGCFVFHVMWIVERQKLRNSSKEQQFSLHRLWCSAVRWQLLRHRCREPALSLWGNAKRDQNNLLYPKCTILFFLCVLISYCLTSHKFKHELHVQIIPQKLYMKVGIKWSPLYIFFSFRSINHSMAPVLCKGLASFSVNLDFFKISSELA